MAREGKGERGQGELARREIDWQAPKSCLPSRSGKARERGSAGKVSWGGEKSTGKRLSLASFLEVEGGARARGVGRRRNQLANSRMEVTRENEAGALGHD